MPSFTYWWHMHRFRWCGCGKKQPVSLPVLVLTLGLPNGGQLQKWPTARKSQQSTATVASIVVDDIAPSHDAAISCISLRQKDGDMNTIHTE